MAPHLHALLWSYVQNDALLVPCNSQLNEPLLGGATAASCCPERASCCNLAGHFWARLRVAVCGWLSLQVHL